MAVFQFQFILKTTTGIRGTDNHAIVIQPYENLHTNQIHAPKRLHQGVLHVSHFSRTPWHFAKLLLPATLITSEASEAARANPGQAVLARGDLRLANPS